MAEWPYSTARWQRIRKLKLSTTLFCEYRLKGCTGIPTQVDHKQAIKAGGAPFDLANLAAVCHRCHSIKTNEQDGGAFKRTRPDIDPATGLPINRHWWSEKSLGADSVGPLLQPARRVSSSRIKARNGT